MGRVSPADMSLPGSEVRAWCWGALCYDAFLLLTAGVLGNRGECEGQGELITRPSTLTHSLPQPRHSYPTHPHKNPSPHSPATRTPLPAPTSPPPASAHPAPMPPAVTRALTPLTCPIIWVIIWVTTVTLGWTPMSRPCRCPPQWPIRKRPPSSTPMPSRGETGENRWEWLLL